MENHIVVSNLEVNVSCLPMPCVLLMTAVENFLICVVALCRANVGISSPRDARRLGKFLEEMEFTWSPSLLLPVAEGRDEGRSRSLVTLAGSVLWIFRK